MKNIIFDLGGVLVNIDQHRIQDQLSRVLAPADVKTGEALFRRSSLKDSYETGGITTGAFFRALREHLHIRDDLIELERLWCEIFSENTYLTAMLPRLKQNRRLLVLSNTNELHLRYIKENYHFMEHFETVFASFQMGRIKPDPEIFKQVTRETGILPCESLFIDDSSVNTAAAENLGFNVIHFLGNSQLVSVLKKYDIF